MKRYLVIGADGFIGKNLCSALAKDNYVRAVDISDMEFLRSIPNVECVKCNILEISDYKELLMDVDGVFYLVCTTVPHEGTDTIPKEIEYNLIPLTILLENLVKCDIDNLVFMSTAGVIYGNSGGGDSESSSPEPICSYGVLKQASEDYVAFYNRVYGKHYKVVRASNPYGWGQGKYKNQGIIPIYVDALINEKPIVVYGDGENVRNYIMIDDLIDALIMIIDNNECPDVLNVGSKQNLSINEIIELIERISGRRFVEIQRVPHRLCDVTVSSPDVSLIKQELGWEAKVPIEEGIDRIYKVMK